MNLERLLRRIRDGVASGDEVQACRALLATEPRVPDDLRDDLLTDDPTGDAAGLLALFGADDLDLASALRQELATEMAFDPAELDLGWEVPLAEAVRFEAGVVELADVVGGALGHGPRPLLAAALLAVAGPVELWGAVAQAIGAASVPVAEAIRQEAGEVSLWAAVSEEIDPSTARAVVRGAANNNRWWWSGLLAAAAAALLVVGWPTAEEAPLVFAGSAETRVEEVIASDRVTVMQLQGDEGALILWIEDNEPGEVL